jgi:outer membrane receptor protein involved in Fe transport
MRAAIGLPPITTPLAQDACLTLGVDYVPSRIFEKIDESNTSWRLGADWQITQRSMVYASVTQGYKDGAFNASGASLLAQLAPVKPESLRSYEIGTKIGFDEAQVNAAVYHYDYSNKQILGFRIDPIQGSLNQLVNIPKAKVDGAEIELTVRPFGGLILTGSTNYNRSEVTSDFFNPDAFTNIYNFKGSQLPRSPEWAADADAEYDWTVTREKTAFVGAHANYTARDSAAFSSSADPRSAIFVDPTRTLIDLRLGIESARWRAMLWSRNITDKYYYSVYSVLDTIDRMAGMPRTFGITVSYKFQ